MFINNIYNMYPKLWVQNPDKLGETHLKIKVIVIVPAKKSSLINFFVNAKIVNIKIKPAIGKYPTVSGEIAQILEKMINNNPKPGVYLKYVEEKVICPPSENRITEAIFS